MSNVLVATPRSTSKFTPEQIACFYFKPFITEDGDPTGLQICKASGKTRKHVPKSGFTNLVSHVRSDHGNIEVEMEAASNAATGTNLPFSFVEMESTRRRRVGDRQDTRVVSAIISRERNIALAYRSRVAA
ncbi:hypothetical protein PC116_g25650 [Phytophthora cactorum]|nr:hypothetical protein PC119_g23118 [Phytophthora cactorum]KAG2993385.1 hypothetical protein PC120_g22259 [Phytophthora cactorum]KAG4225936.1 hypothetical protein PC116_g25650 [Phytophthora cactorum]